MAKRQSISERLRSAKSPEAVRATVSDWAQDWQRDQEDIVRQFEQAVSNMDYDDLCSATGQLKEVTRKRFEALQNVLRRLTDDLDD